MPSAPGLGRGEHPAASAHVTVGGLTGSVGTASTHARDTSHGTTRAPRGGRGLVASFAAHAVWLSGVLHHFVVDKTDDVRSDGRFEDGWKVNFLAGDDLVFLAVNADHGTCCHLDFPLIIYVNANAGLVILQLKSN